jgi:DNA invertase Pin-like site-specific DNA recombinase
LYKALAVTSGGESHCQFLGRIWPVLSYSQFDMAKLGSNKPKAVQLQTIELSISGYSNRRIAKVLGIRHETVARILKGPIMAAIVGPQEERLKRAVDVAWIELEEAMRRKGVRAAFALLRNSGTFESAKARQARQAQFEREENEREVRREILLATARAYPSVPGLSRERGSQARADRNRLAMLENPQDD